jgi:diacylglycerol kinase family enzyme
VPGIGVINNPHSRKNVKHPDRMDSLGHIVGTKGTSAATQEVRDIDGMARLFCEQDIDILAVNGGDGSASLVLTAMLRAYKDKPLPKVAMLRGGTMNNVANSCGIKGTPAGLMMNLVEKYRRGAPFETTFRDTLKIEDRYGFIFGNGFIVEFLEALYGSGKKTPFTTAKLLARGAVSGVTGGSFAKKLFERINARVILDGKEIDYTRFSALAAATVREIGLRFKPFFRCEEKAGSFHVLAAISSPFSMVMSLRRAYMGRKISEKRMVEFVASKMVIESQKPIKYTLDGEVYKAGNTLEVTMGPRLELVVC